MRPPPFAVLLGLAFLGCGGRAVVRLAPLAALKSAWGIAVYPVAFRFPVSPYESYVRGQELADQLSSTTNALVYGPGEFRVIDFDDDDPRHGSTIGSAVRYSDGHTPAGLYVLRTIVKEITTKTDAVAVRDTSGHVRGIRDGDMSSEVTIRLELLSFATHVAIAHVEDTSRIDLLNVSSGGDPLPDVTRLTRKLLDIMIQTAGLEENHKPVEIGLTVVPVLAPALAFTSPGQQSLSAALSRIDAIDREARLLALVRRADPSAPRARQRVYQSVPSGLVATAVSGLAARSGLSVDDVLLTADDEPLTGRFVLDRHLANGRCVLHVRHAGTEGDVNLVTK
jgi:hypothetical protein